MNWAIMVHGGLKTLAAEEEERCRLGSTAALRAGQRVLEDGGSSLDAAEAAVRALEADDFLTRASAPR